MNLIERVIFALLWLCAIVLAFFLIIWVLGTIGLALPATVITILKVMLVLVAILVLIRIFYPYFSGRNLFGDPRP